MDLSVIKELLPMYLNGCLVTIELTIASMIIGTVIGIFLALFKISHIKILNYISGFYISVFRGTPLLLQIIFIYYTLPSFGIELSPITAGIIALSLNFAAYMAETIRGGILAIEVGQFEASKALGFNYFQTMSRIILPQTIRIILPPVGNLTVAMLKDTSLVSAISLVELMRAAQQMYSTTFRPVETFILAGVFYFIMTTVLTRMYIFIEKKLTIY